MLSQGFVLSLELFSSGTMAGWGSASLLTQAMFDGLDHFWRTRLLDDIIALKPDNRAARCDPALHPRMVRVGLKSFRACMCSAASARSSRYGKR